MKLPLIHHDSHAKNIAILKDWQLFFEEKDGYPNRQEVMIDFSRFYHHLKDHEITISGKCLLSGLIYGDPRFKDGEEIFTSLITHFARVAKEYCRGVEHELICPPRQTSINIIFMPITTVMICPICYWIWLNLINSVSSEVIIYPLDFSIRTSIVTSSNLI